MGGRQAEEEDVAGEDDYDTDDVADAEDEYSEEDAEEEESPAPTREISLDDEPVTLRGDQEHTVPGPKIRLKKKAKKKSEDELQELYENVVEEAPRARKSTCCHRSRCLRAATTLTTKNNSAKSVERPRFSKRHLETSDSTFGWSRSKPVR